MMTNHGNRVTQGQFSYLPDLTDAQITKQIEYALQNDWAVNVEYTDDPHPRNTYWEMFGNPMFDLKDAAGILMEINNCRKTFPNHYVRVTAFDSTKGWETPRMSYLAQHVDLLIGVVPVINLEWIQKLHRDKATRGHSAEAVTDTILRRMHDYVNYICPQFSRTHINFSACRS